MHTANIASTRIYSDLLERNGCTIAHENDLSGLWKQLLVQRLEMYRSLRDTTIAKFGEARFYEYASRPLVAASRLTWSC